MSNPWPYDGLPYSPWTYATTERAAYRGRYYTNSDLCTSLELQRRVPVLWLFSRWEHLDIEDLGYKSHFPRPAEDRVRSAAHRWEAENADLKRGSVSDKEKGK